MLSPLPCSRPAGPGFRVKNCLLTTVIERHVCCRDYGQARSAQPETTCLGMSPKIPAALAAQIQLQSDY